MYKSVFTPGFNIITGLNGTGKTSIIDAIYCLAFGRSYFVSKDSFLIREGSDFLRLEGYFTKQGDTDKVVLKSEKGKAKIIEFNDVKRKKLADHIGHIPIVCIAPADILLVIESSNVRRALLDKLLCQLDRQYLQDLVKYNRLLKQRNAALKNQTPSTEALLQTFDQAMAPLAAAIYTKRNQILDEWLTNFTPIYNDISERAESCSFIYKSQLSSQNYLSGTVENRQKDMITKRSNFGIHKDDINFKIGDRELKYIGSQGQIKTFLFSLKMAQFKILTEKHGVHPIVLLDDVFDKLDARRVGAILGYINSNLQSQVFVTDTSIDRVGTILDNSELPYHHIAIQ